MSEVIIKVAGVSKKYTLGRSRAASGDGLRHVVQDALVARFRRHSASNAAPENSQSQEFWALKDVSFEVKRGEVVGIIGRNGAGKSTLLKILSRITEPTSGRIEIEGRVASLLEVGTGFHPELSGRENIFLNGAILGMSRKEIRSKFDEIVAFAEVDRFLDTPVKRYSSGMYVRLAFAVAAHLEPEILIVDEVLAVGDAEFQKKCFGKIQEVSGLGRTILFVSHNMAAVENLCSSAMLLHSGSIVFLGETGDVINKYQTTADKSLSVPLGERLDRQGGGSFRFTSIEILNGMKESVQAIPSGSGAMIRLRFQAETPIESPICYIGIYDARGVQIAHFNTQLKNFQRKFHGRRGQYNCSIPHLPLNSGIYYLNIALYSGSQLLDRVEKAATLRISEADVYKTGKQLPSHEGYLLLNHEWECEEIYA
jgi:lipopolysaccharide transport system ATP-binding protein